MSTLKKRRAQEIEFRAAGMTLAQVKRSTARGKSGNGGLILATAALFALAAGAGGYLAFGQSDATVDVVTDSPIPVSALSVAAPSASDLPDAQMPVSEDSVSEITVAPAPIAPPAETLLSAAVAEVAPIEVAVDVRAAPPVFEDTSTSCIQDLDAVAASLTVPFAPYATQADPTTLTSLFDLAGQLNGCDGAYLVVAGHADPSGNETENLLLSWQRAEFVIASLQGAGFDPNRF